MSARLADSTARVPKVPERLAGDYASCQRLARDHYENFPVASRLLPSYMRPHVAAVYAFARVADDFADEGNRPPSERHALLDGWLVRLRACSADRSAELESPSVPIANGPSATRVSPTHASEHEIFAALGHTIRTCRLPVALLDDLVSAFRQDITTSRYASWEEVLDYCGRSANPVGRLVLRIAGYEEPALDAASDCVCTALQLTNFWQDLAIDWRRGRLYVPSEVYEACGARPSDLDTGQMTHAWRAALRQVSRRTRELFAAGRPVCDRVPGRLGFELRLTWLGGTTILDRLERVDFDVFGHRPFLGASDVPLLLWRACRWEPSEPTARRLA